MNYTLKEADDLGPSKEERISLQVHDFAKLVFQPAGRLGSEKMWVRITQRRLAFGIHIYEGVLENHPILFRQNDLRIGDGVTFTHANVVEILRAELAVS